jgi:O-antigen/teichoic acid export membrane protein
MISIIISGLINLGLNFWLVPVYGYTAAAVTTLVSYVLLSAIMVVLSRKYFSWGFPFRSLGKIAVATVGMGGAVYYLKNNLGLSIFLNLIICMVTGMVIYVVLLIMFAEMRKEEMRELRIICEKIYRRGRND